MLVCTQLREESDNSTAADLAKLLTISEKETILKMGQTPHIYEHLARSLAPTICGHDEIKKGILLQLFGGVHKVTKDRSNLRGDINICIVGNDTSTQHITFASHTMSLSSQSLMSLLSVH